MKKLLSVIVLFVLALALTLTVSAAGNAEVERGFCGAQGGTNLGWKFTEDGTVTISGSGAMEDYSFDAVSYSPNAPWGKYKADIKKIVFEEGITHIGVNAFNNMYNVNTKIVIPNSVISIGDMAFSNCSRATGIVLGENVETIGQNAFYFATSVMGKLTLPEKLTSIGNGAFEKASFTGSVTVPEGVESVGRRAFYGSGITSFYFMGNPPKEVVGNLGGITEGNQSFDPADKIYGHLGKSWEITDGKWNGYTAERFHVDHPNAIAMDSCGYVVNQLVWVLEPDGTLIIKGEGEMDDYTVMASRPWNDYEDQITSLVFEEGITKISTCAFTNFGKIDGALVLPDSLIEVGAAAFSGCIGIDSITFGENLEIIGVNAFSEMEEISGDLVIPDKVTTIGRNAFTACVYDGSLILGKSVESIGSYAFANNHRANSKVVIPASVKTVEDNVFYNSSVTDIYFEGNTPSVLARYDTKPSFKENDTLYYVLGNESWEENILNNGWKGYSVKPWDGKDVSNIDVGYCGDESNVIWTLSADGTLTISGSGRMAKYVSASVTPWFKYTNEINTIVIEEGITSIGDYSLSCLVCATGEIVIPDSVTYIGNSAFEANYGITGITLGKNVNYIGNKAFYGVEEISGDLVIPDSVLYIGDGAFMMAEFDGNLILGENVGYIGKEAFARNSNSKTDVIIPASVQDIGEGAFTYSNFRNFYFKGAEPTATAKGETGASFGGNNSVIFYPVGEESWNVENGLWKGYTAKGWYANAIASGYCGAEGEGTNLEWNITAEGTLVIYGEGAMNDYDVVEVNGEYVPDAPWYGYCDQIKKLVLEEGITTIGGWAFYGLTGLAGTELVLPDSIEEIGRVAFRDCGFVGELVLPANLKVVCQSAFVHAGEFTGTLVIPEGTEKISDYAFRDGAYSKVIIPASVTEIGDAPFAYNYCLKEITVAENNPNYCAVDGVLFNKEKTELIQFPGAIAGEYRIPESVVTIKNNAFVKTKLDTIYIHENLESVELIGYYLSGTTIVFEGNKVQISGQALPDGGNVIFMNGAPASVVAAGETNASFGENIKLYYLAGTENLWNFDENGKWNGYTVTPVDYVAAPEFDASAYVTYGFCGDSFGGRNIVWLLDEEGTLTLRGSGRMRDYNPNANDRLGCGNVKKVVIEEGIEYIGAYAFYANEMTATPTFANSVTEIGEYAFANCSDMAGSLVLPQNLKKVGIAAFVNCENIIGELAVPEGCTSVDQIAFGGTNISSIVIPASLTEIGNRAFLSSNIKTIVVHEDNPAFCAVNNVLFTADQKTLMQYCTGSKAEKYVIPDGVETIFTGAFRFSSLKNVVIPEGVKTIGGEAFRNNAVMETVTVPASVESIGKMAFADMDALSEVYFKGNAPEVIGYNESGYSFNAEKVTLYYNEGTSGWELDSEGKWNGYNIVKNEYGATISVSSVMMTENATKTVSVSISEGSKAKMLQFAVKYDASKLELASCSVGEAFADADINTENPGIIYFAWDDSSAVTEEEIILEIEFKALKGSKDSEIKVEIADDEKFVVAGNNAKDILTRTEAGFVKVISVVYGDINEDGSVDIRDAYIARMISAKLYNASEKEMISGDVDGDGKINVIDANIIRKYCVKKINKFPADQAE